MAIHMKKRIPQKTWDDMKLAHASRQIGLREIARRLGVNENTLKSRARREGWTAQLRSAVATVPDPAPTITVQQALAESLNEHREQFQQNTARALTNASRAASRLDDTAALGSSRKLADLVSAGAKLHGLGAAETQVAVSVLNCW